MTTPTTLTITAPISISDEDFGEQVNTALAGLGPIAMIDAEYKISNPAGSNKQVSILYYPGAGQIYGAIGIVAREGDDMDALVAAWALANPTFRPLRLFDISPEQVRVSISESILIFYSTLPDVARPIVVRNSAGAIAAGATGSVTALGTAGPTTRIYTVRNMGDTPFGTTREAYAAFDPISGEWLAVPYGC